MTTVTILWIPYFLLYVNLIFFVSVKTPLTLLCLLFFFVFSSAFLFFSLGLYFFTLLFLSVYAGAVLVLFLFIFMFLQQENIVNTNKNSSFFIFFFFFILSLVHFLLFLKVPTNEFPFAYLGKLPYSFESTIVFYAKKLYFDFVICFLTMGYIFFTVLVGVTDLLDND